MSSSGWSWNSDRKYSCGTTFVYPMDLHYNSLSFISLAK